MNLAIETLGKYLNDPPKEKKNGLDIKLYESGGIERERMWKDKIWSGTETYRYESGSKEIERTWKNGYLHGMGTWRREDGTKKKEIHYINGVEYAKIERNSKGNVTKVSFPTPPPKTNPIAKLKDLAILYSRSLVPSKEVLYSGPSKLSNSRFLL